jgi:hypothetical protein
LEFNIPTHKSFGVFKINYSSEGAIKVSCVSTSTRLWVCDIFLTGKFYVIRVGLMRDYRLGLAPAQDSFLPHAAGDPPPSLPHAAPL